MDKICTNCNQLQKHKGLGLCKNCYNQSFHLKNKEKIALRKQKTMKEYYLKNKEKLKEKVRKWEKENRKLVSTYKKKWKKSNPKKIKAQNYARHHGQRDCKCAYCGSLENLHFHHTNYEKNEGFTLCAKCHKGEHLIRRKG